MTIILPTERAGLCVVPTEEALQQGMPTYRICWGIWNEMDEEEAERFPTYQQALDHVEAELRRRQGALAQFEWLLHRAETVIPQEAADRVQEAAGMVRGLIGLGGVIIAPPLDTEDGWGVGYAFQPPTEEDDDPEAGWYVSDPDEVAEWQGGIDVVGLDAALTLLRGQGDDLLSRYFTWHAQVSDIQAQARTAIKPDTMETRSSEEEVIERMLDTMVEAGLTLGIAPSLLQHWWQERAERDWRHAEQTHRQAQFLGIARDLLERTPDAQTLGDVYQDVVGMMTRMEELQKENRP